MKKINSLGQLISTYRKSNSLTQEQLSKLIGKSRSTIMRYESNSVEIPYDILKKIVTTLNIPAYELEAIKDNGSVSTFRYMEHTNQYFENKSKYYKENSLIHSYMNDVSGLEELMFVFFNENYHYIGTVHNSDNYNNYTYLYIDYKYLYSNYEIFKNNVVHLTYEEIENIYNETVSFFKFKLFSKIKPKG